jgi:hypothetical protein
MGRNGTVDRDVGLAAGPGEGSKEDNFTIYHRGTCVQAEFPPYDPACLRSGPFAPSVS